MLHLVPVLLTDGIRLFDQLGTQPIELERTEVIESRGVTHLRFRVVREDTGKLTQGSPSTESIHCISVMSIALRSLDDRNANNLLEVRHFLTTS
jgi:hypothetical protein